MRHFKNKQLVMLFGLILQTALCMANGCRVLLDSIQQ